MGQVKIHLLLSTLKNLKVTESLPQNQSTVTFWLMAQDLLFEVVNEHALSNTEYSTWWIYQQNPFKSAFYFFWFAERLTVLCFEFSNKNMLKNYGLIQNRKAQNWGSLEVKRQRSRQNGKLFIFGEILATLDKMDKGQTWKGEKAKISTMS